MRKLINLILIILPVLLLSQDTISTEPLKFITIPTINVEYKPILKTKAYKFECTEDLKGYVSDFLDFMDKYNLDSTPLANFDGIYTCNNIEKYGSNLAIGLTFKGVPENGVKFLTILKATALTDSLKTKTIVFHELTHVLTNNTMPHCKDAVNCSVIFYEEYSRIVGIRAELFWDVEEKQLANMIKIYEEFNSKYGK